MMTRRDLIRIGALGGLAGVLPGRGFADGEPAGSYLRRYDGPIPEPDIYTFTLGEITAHVINDGLFLGPLALFFPDLKPAQTAPYLEANFLPTDHVAMTVNVLVLRRPDGIVLIDSGTGPAGAPATGRLMVGLAKLGIAPADVKAVVVTHAHFDHIGGILDSAGQRAFPNADIYLPEWEAKYWLDPEVDLSKVHLPDAMKSDAIAAARRYIAGAGDKLKLIGYATVMPGIEYRPAPGHTGGHAAVMITSGTEKLLHLGDAAHAYAFQLAHPEWAMAADVNRVQSTASRRMLFEQARKERLRVMVGHFPFPGIGHVVADGRKGYRWLPQPWSM